MVREKKCHPTVHMIINDPTIGFSRMEANVKKVLYDQYVQPLDDMFQWMMTEKEHAKQLIREELGQEQLPKTPQRGNPFTRFSSSMDKLRRDLRVDQADAFANEEKPHPRPVRGRHPSAERPRTATRPPASSSRRAPQFHPDKVKQEVPSPETPVLHRPPTHSQHSSRSRHRAAASKTPSSPYVDAVQAVIAKQAQIRKALSPSRHAAPSQPTPPRAARPPPVKKTRNSSMVRKIEAKAKNVISNKEEIIRERAERAKREREEKAYRVQRNNEKKEREREAKLAVIRQREQEIANMRKEQMSPSRSLKVKTPCKIPVRSASRPRKVAAGSETRPVGRPPRVPKNRSPDVFANDVVEATPESPSPRKVAYRLLQSSGAQGSAYRPDRSRIELPEVEVSMSAAQDAEDIVEDHSDVLASIDAVPVEHPHDPEPARETGEEHEERPLAEAKQAEGPDGEDVDEEQRGEQDMDLEEVGDEAVGCEAEKQMEEGSNVVEEGAGHGGNGETSLLDSSQIKNKMLANVTNLSSYDMTPEKLPLPSTEDNYNIDDLSSGDETDDEERPMKKIPEWAQPKNLRKALREQRLHPPFDVDEFFGAVEPPNLEKLFKKSGKTRYRARTSSARWSSPLSNPSKGTSKYFAMMGTADH